MALPPTTNLAVEGIMGRQNRESQNARKPPPAPSFLAKSNTCSGQISPIDQAFQNSSRATRLAPLQTRSVAGFLAQSLRSIRATGSTQTHGSLTTEYANAAGATRESALFV